MILRLLSSPVRVSAHLHRQILRKLRPRQLDPLQPPKRGPREPFCPALHVHHVVVGGRWHDDVIWTVEVYGTKQVQQT